MSVQLRVFLTWLLLFVVLVLLQGWFRNQGWERTATALDGWAFASLFALPVQFLWWIWS